MSEQKVMSAPFRGLAILTADILVMSVWVSTCAVTPEFIWRGARLAAGHITTSDVAAALLFGLILAFCIEPSLERLRPSLQHNAGSDEHGRARRSLLFPAAEGFVFALVTICLHSSISTFLAAHAETEVERHLGLINGLELALAWATVPFCITLAWAVPVGMPRPLRWALIVLAALSPVLAAWGFSWGWRDWVTGEVPGLAILFAGLKQQHLGAPFFRRTAVKLCWIAAIWLIAATLYDSAVELAGYTQAAIYSHIEFWIDARFYCGWMIGLLIVPELPRAAAR
jgi:hypothetical protein